MGLNLSEYKEVIDVIVSNENTASYWLNKISEFKARGIKELFMVAMLENENMNRAIKYYIKKLENDIPYMLQLYEYPIEIRKLIYTTNPIESLNSALRKVTNGKGYFVNERTLEKVLCLRVKELENKRVRTTKLNWGIILNELIEIFGERVEKYIKI